MQWILLVQQVAFVICGIGIHRFDYSRTQYWQAEAGLSELDQKIVSLNLLCLQLTSVQSRRSWVRILSYPKHFLV